MTEEDTRMESVHDVKVGKYMVIEGEPCKITDVNRSAPGKHGHAKFRITAVSLLNPDKKKVVILTGGSKMEVPFVDKRSAQALSISGDTCNAMDMATFETFDIPIVEEMKSTLKENDQFMYWVVLGQKVMTQKK